MISIEDMLDLPKLGNILKYVPSEVFTHIAEKLDYLYIARTVQISSGLIFFALTRFFYDGERKYDHNLKDPP